MGHLKYAGDAAPVMLDDELLTHLKVVIVTKLRRHEAFALTFSTRDGAAVETLWMHPSIPLRIAIESEVVLDRGVLMSLMEGASSAAGLDLTRDEFASLMAGARSLSATSA